MTDPKLISAWRRCCSAKGEQHAADILIRFGADANDPSPHDVPDAKVDAATAALSEGVPAARASATPKSFEDAGFVRDVYARFNAAGQKPKASAEG
jgi:hypothetical protein